MGLLIDFRDTFWIWPESLYEGGAAAIPRLATLRGPFLQDLMQRYFSYLARVAV